MLRKSQHKVDELALKAKALLEKEEFKDFMEMYADAREALMDEIINAECDEIMSYSAFIYASAQKLKTINLMIARAQTLAAQVPTGEGAA